MILGSMGSGKTAATVWEIMHDQSNMTYFSNIITKGVKNNVVIKPEWIVNKEPIVMENGKQCLKNGMPQYKYSVNREFWETASKKYKGLNVVIDEAHSVLNARRGMNKVSVAIMDWMALLRRVLGSTQAGYGRLYLITQIERRLDIIAKEQSTEARFHLCHYLKTCKKCGFNVQETNECPEPIYVCPFCNNELWKHSHTIEVWKFKDYQDFVSWKYMGQRRTYYSHYFITDIETVFNHYNTMQWDNLLTDI